MDNPLTPPDVDQAIRHNTSNRNRHITQRLALAAGLCAVPCVAHLVGYDAVLPALGTRPPGSW